MKTIKEIGKIHNEKKTRYIKVESFKNHNIDQGENVGHNNFMIFNLTCYCY